MTTLKLKILKNGKQTHGATSDQFESVEAFEAWKQSCIASNVWGLPERWLPDSLMSPLSEEQKAMALESRTVEVMGQEVVEYRLPSEYQIDVQDITAEIEAEKQAKEAKKLAKEKRKDERKKLDWNKINTVAELKAIVKNLVEDRGEE